ncbi:MAG: hypothetical protein AB7Q97_26720 [Gammaproteobacteria bacterium]
MNDRNYSVVHWGTGNTGRHVLRMLLGHPRRTLVGLGVSSPAKEGRDAGELCGLPPAGVRASRDLDALLALKPDCLTYMGTEYGRPEGAVIDDLCRILERGVNVVSTAMPALIYPASISRDAADRLDAAGRRGGASVFTTGIEPGYLGDALPLTLTSLCERVDRVIVQQKVNNATYDEPTGLAHYGYGKAPERDAADYRPGSMTYIWRGVVHMFAAGMGLALDEVRELRETATVPRDIQVGRTTIPAGTVSGIRFRIQGIVGAEPIIEIDRQDVLAADVGLHWPQPFPGRERTRHCRIVIEGMPRIEADVDMHASDSDPTLSGVIATAARAVNAIPWVHAAAPGLVTNLDLPGITGAGVLRPGRG